VVSEKSAITKARQLHTVTLKDMRELKMNRTILRRLKTIDPADILIELSARQHLAPRKSLEDVLTHVAAKLGLTLSSVRSAARRIELDPAGSVGRLKRAELENLARFIHRAYRHEIACAPVA